ncbi:hypothetical protein [Paenibacillus mendelii]|uniref:Uncharacterized protein n=1 Tax=Paenibacillus mendelii TaxID=206163 RepID=A0ABV6JLI8_9BACL|nr:hypothetical protein [Paenibacillus mendelii]MCQ6564129.1 hypothetical protein [Paenibacillus mendelii]
MIRFMVYSLVLFLFGLFSIAAGLFKGKDWVADFINPSKIESVDELVRITNAFIYLPVIFGGLIIVLGLIIFAIVFNNWTKKYL